MHMAAQPRRQAQRHDLEDATHGIPGLHAFPDARAHGFHDRQIGTTQIVALGQLETSRVGQRLKPVAVRLHAADHGDVAADAHTELGQQRLADRADRDTRSGLAGAGPFKRETQVTVAVFHRAGQISVAGPWRGHRVDVPLAPLGVVLVFDQQRDGRAGGLAGHNAAENASLVALDFHASAGAIGSLPARQVLGKIVGRQRQPGRHAFQYCSQCRAMRLAGGKET